MFYEVTCRCGHSSFGKHYYFVVKFAVEATSASDAAQRVRWQPRCQHHKKDAILDVQLINRHKAEEIKSFNKNDPFLSVYLNVNNVQDQRRLIPIEVMLDHLHEEAGREEARDEPQSSVRIFSGKSQIKHPNKFFKYQPDELWVSHKVAGF